VGDRVPADIRLIDAVSLEIDESALTGETRPARKNTDVCDRGEGEDTRGEGGGKALGERHCMAFMGTLVRSGEMTRSSRVRVSECLTRAGHGSGIVVGTGKDSEFGVIFSMMQDVSTPFPRTKSAATMSCKLTMTIGRGEENTPPATHGRSGETIVHLLLRHHRDHHCRRRTAEAGLARDVHDRRSVIYITGLNWYANAP